jgi:hypothetical protein
VVSGVRVAALTAALAVQAVMVRGRTGVHLRAVAKTGEGLAGFSDAGVCLIDAWSFWTWGRNCARQAGDGHSPAQVLDSWQGFARSSLYLTLPSTASPG